MKIGISNIAWKTGQDNEVFSVLRTFGISGVEVAPTKIWPGWVNASAAEAKKIRVVYEDQGLSVPSLQAILFGKPELHVFGDSRSTRLLEEHIGFVAKLAEGMGAKKVVFGSPNNRLPGALSQSSAWEAAVMLFRRLGAICVDSGVELCIEANPPEYGCKFITTFNEASDFVDAVESEGVRLHFDTACAYLAADALTDIERRAHGIQHAHVSEPQLAGFSGTKLPHASYRDVLRNAGFEGWAIIEMKSADEDDLSRIEHACQYVLTTYEPKLPVR